MTTNEQSVINKANDYLQNVGILGYSIKSIKYHQKKSAAALLGEHLDLLADLDLSEISVIEDFGRAGWAVTYEYADPSADPAPNAPTVYVYDDGGVSLVVPI